MTETKETIELNDILKLGFYALRDRIFMQTAPMGTSATLLTKVPHRMICDIPIVYRFLLNQCEEYEASVIVSNEMLDNLGVTRETFISDADFYAPLLKPLVIMPFKDLFEGFIVADTPLDSSLLIATNESRMYGASVLGYPEFFKKAAEIVGGDYYILPSSIHEVLILPDRKLLDRADGEADELKKIVREVNESCVDPKERLSDSAYHYSVRDDIFEKR